MKQQIIIDVDSIREALDDEEIQLLNILFDKIDNHDKQKASMNPVFIVKLKNQKRDWF